MPKGQGKNPFKESFKTTEYEEKLKSFNKILNISKVNNTDCSPKENKK